MDQNLALLPVIFYRRRWPAIATFIAVICGAIAYLVNTPRLYEAKVRLMLDDKQVSISELGRDLATMPNTPNANPMATQAELARSQRVLQVALSQLSASGTDNGSDRRLSLGQLKSGLKTSIVPATQILEMSYRSQNPFLTAQVLNAVAEAMVKENAENIRSEAGSARKFLSAEVPKKRDQLAQAEAILSQYKQSQGIVSLTDASGQDNSQTKSLIASLTNLEDQERALSAQLQEVTLRNNSLQKVTDSGTIQNTYAAVQTGQDDELKSLRAKLADLESQVAISRSRFTDDNPGVKTLLEQRDATRTLYAEKISELLANNPAAHPSANPASAQVSQELSTKLILGEVERSALVGKLEVVRQERLNLQNRLNQLPARERVLAALTRQRAEAATSLELLQRKLEEARIAEAQLVSNLKIIDLAEPPNSPSWPKKPVVLAVATASGFVLAIGVVLLLEVLDGTLRNAAEAEDLVKLPVLGVLPALPRAAMELDRPELLLRDPALLESYRTLLKSIEFRSAEDLQVVVVSSTLSGEGKSLVVSYLGAVSAMLSRRTLIVDADLRRPIQHKLFDLEVQPGLTDVVNGHFTLADVVQRTGIRNLSLLSSGTPYLHPSEFFESKQMHHLIAEAAEDYDLVIVDTPPVTSCVDALTLSCDRDRLLLVARPKFTQKDVLIRAVTELTNNGIGILGVAVNGIDPQVEKFYRYSLQGYQ
jgi:capsular exopolysaccharide synthesis family protein